MTSPFHLNETQGTEIKVANADNGLTRQGTKILSTPAKRGAVGQETQAPLDPAAVLASDEKQFTALEKGVQQKPKTFYSVENSFYDKIDAVDKIAGGVLKQEQAEFAKIDPEQYRQATTDERLSMRELQDSMRTCFQGADRQKVQQFAADFVMNAAGARAEILAADPSGRFLKALENYQKAEENPLLKRVKGIEAKTNDWLDDSISFRDRLARMYVDHGAPGDTGTALQVIWNAKQWETLRNRDRFFPAK